jgi:hypothetical protein
VNDRSRYKVRALWLFGERYEAEGWLEIRRRGPDVNSWESRCEVTQWNHPELTGTMPISVRLELAAGGRLSGRAYVDQAFHLWGDKADVMIRGIGQGLKVWELGAGDYVVKRRDALKELALLPFRVLVFIVLAAASIILAIFLLALMFAPEMLLPARPGF